MAIYHCSAKVIGRSGGRSATGAAAYRAGEKIIDQRSGVVHDYSRKGGVDHSEVIAPSGSPAWATDRSVLWNQVEQVEKRKDAQLCREVEVALPRELSLDGMRSLASDYARETFVAKGMVADINIHHADTENPHAHILLTTRVIDRDGFGKKNRDWNRKELLQQWRSSWEKHANRALEKAGVAERIDHRSLSAQGIERIPQLHVGVKVVEMEQRGIATERGARALAIEQANAELQQLTRYREAIDHECDRQITASQEPRGGSGRDRAVSPGLGDTGRRNPGEPESPAGREQAAGSELDAGAGGDGRSVEGLGQYTEKQRSGTDPGGRDGTARGKGLALETLDRGGTGFGHAYAGAADRVMGLGRSVSDGTERDHVSDHADNAVDRTGRAVARQLKAMDCYGVEVGIRRNGRMMTREWCILQTMKSIDWLKRENAKGADIFIRPRKDNQGLVLVDDLSKTQLAKMKADGVEPAVVIETSPQNYQAWVRLSQHALSPEVATAAGKALATDNKDDRADLSRADDRQFSRLAGFTNQAPEHTTESGYSPWVLCHDATGQQAIRAAEIEQKALNSVLQHNALQEKKQRLEALKIAQKPTYYRDPVAEYRKQLKTITEYVNKHNDTQSLDLSRADYMICKNMAKQGYKPEQIQEALETASPELPIRKAHHENDYCEKTVRAAVDSPDVQRHLEEKQYDRSRGIGLGY